VTITFPGSYITTQAVTAVPADFTAGSPSTVSGNTQVILTVAAGKTINAGAVTVTLTGATLGEPTPAGKACTTTFKVETQNDFSGSAFQPQLGGQVSSVSLALSTTAADRLPGATNKPVTVAFTIANALGEGKKVTITFPGSYITTQAVTAVPADFTAGSPSTVQGNTQVILTVASGKTINAGAVTVTLTGATLGTPTPAGTTSGSAYITVGTSYDLVGQNNVYPALGGVLTAPKLTIADSERVAQLDKRRFFVEFTTSNDLGNGDKVTVSLPNNFVTDVTQGSVTGIKGTAAFSSPNIIISVTDTVKAGALQVTICGVTLGNAVAAKPLGFSVYTSKDYTSACSTTGPIGTPQGTVSDVSLTIPFANRVAGSTGQSIIVAFTTATPLPINVAGTCFDQNMITIALPSSFVGSGTDGVNAAGIAGYAIDSNDGTTIKLKGTAALPAAPYTVTISGLTLGNKNNGADNSVKVSTNLDLANSGAPSGPISGYQVSSLTVSACQATSACSNLIIGFNAAGVASTIAPSASLAFEFNTIPISGSPDPIYVNGAVLTGSISSNTLTLTVSSDGAAWVIGSSTTITVTGLSIAAANQLSQITLKIGSSTGSTVTVDPTSTGTTTTTGLTIANPKPGVQNTQITIAFTTTAGIDKNDVVRIFYPTGFFINAPTVAASCTAAQSSAYSISASSSTSTCSEWGSIATGTWGASSYMDITLKSDALSAGSQTLVVSGITLSATEKTASNSFYVVTQKNFCSAGKISTGSISNPGPNNGASTGSTLIVSAAAACACMLLYLL